MDKYYINIYYISQQSVIFHKGAIFPHKSALIHSDKCPNFIPPENTLKPKVFWFFQGV